MGHNEIVNYLKKNNIKASVTRLKIYEYLVGNNNHPTAEMIYDHLIKEIPTLSKTTIYNVLDLFIEKGIASSVLIEDNKVRFDAKLGTHAHFKCELCHEIYDIPTSNDMREMALPKGFKVNEEHIYFKGICPRCIKKSKN